MNNTKMENKSFLLLLALVSVAFATILLPFYGAVFWGTILAIIFQPVQRRLEARLGQRRGWAAALTLLIILLIVILPLSLLAGALVQEGANFYERISSGTLDVGGYLQQVVNALPEFARDLLERFGLADLAGVQARLSEFAMSGSQFLATKAFSIGQNTFQFLISFAIMLYLLFFLLRDGRLVAAQIRRAIPLGQMYKQHLLSKFTTVVKATVKGNIAVAAIQGALGGFIFWVLGLQGAVLWGVLMAVLSLLPAVGASLIWGPVAIYFLATGAIWQAAVLTAFGAVVIGLADNVLRPILVGKDTKLPDYVVLISTLGGIALFGLNGFVIGPLIAALFMAAWSLYAEAREEQEVVAVPAVPAEDEELPDESAEVAAAAVPAEEMPASELPDSARP
ncbi:MAG: AI-2E family transporter [Pseudomonadaceae bacterium]|jgi:predicted PurR-regulated permease PerM|uniref:Predicted PurR-regulated permease PerM n=1 Tax=Halopseudomonas formosensis TaxID=1002526 RepID=A0A1I6AT38_9GAMM|nr:AI-2E family transporter [Halopseudomonas formosensis]MDY3198646.1 AI-2E family transporter [Pseudomonadaceae bacterium]NLC00081.1 AI-2E family transporter [Halopseudomonas formosensis]SFQ71697.1 Predicted PurR-regulated permease PerM [Halopseudomonas formosensis]